VSLEKYLETRQQTERLCEPLEVEDYIPQAVEFASPPKWHLAHVSWFFEEMILRKYLPGYPVFDEDFNFLFNSYYQTCGERAIRAERGLMSRPTVDRVYQYRQHVDRYMTRLLSSAMTDEVMGLVTLGINHEQQHQELLLTDLKYVFALNPVCPVYEKESNLVADINHEEGWLDFDEGVYEIGHRGDGFCFDNELANHKTYLTDYRISRSLVTNGEFMEFIEGGGYQNFQHWLDEGWAWVNNQRIEYPLYWQKSGEKWFYFTLAGLKPVDPQAILAHVSYYEAYAFASWKNCRLPTEFEWEAASGHFGWGKRWEWTSSAYQPYPGYAVSQGAVGEYNGKFMVNQMVLRGSSVATAKGHSRKTYRNFFHPFHQWQYSGIRLAR
jgi:ergothioneine biosynthesis protein EgtB